MNPASDRLFGRLYYGWVVVAVTFAAVVVSAGIRAAPQALIIPLEQDFGWDRAQISFAVSSSLLFYGVSAPIAGRLLDLRGPRGVMMVFLALTLVGITVTGFMNSLWHFNLAWGVVVGLGTGGMVGALGASIAVRWFTTNRGLVMGLLTAASSTGQSTVVPIAIATMAVVGWRATLLGLAAILGLIILPAIWFLVRNDPATPLTTTPARGVAAARPIEPSISVTQAMRTRSFWTFCGMYFICGATDSGLIGTHLLSHAVDRGVSSITAGIVIAVMGIMNLGGTTFAGWCSDRFDHRRILAVIFLTRTLSLVMLPFMSDLPGLLVFALFYGLSWIATGPPTASYIAERFGRRSIGTVFGTLMLVHQFGSAGSAFLSGVVRVQTGDYTAAFLAGAGLTVVASLLALTLFSTRQPQHLEPLAASA